MSEQRADATNRSSGVETIDEIMGAEEIDRTLDALADSVVADFASLGDLCLVGIRRRGDSLAVRLRDRLAARLGAPPQCGSLDITLYRDDFDSLTQDPIITQSDIPFSLDGRIVLLVDDVLFSGRTIRAALDEILDLGRPARIVLAVLIDRGWRELPIAADLVGRRIATGHDDDVQVLLRETDGRDAVVLRASSEATG